MRYDEAAQAAAVAAAFGRTPTTGAGAGPDQVSEAAAAAFGRTVDDDRVKALTGAGMTEAGAAQVLALVDRDGMTPSGAFAAATAFGEAGKIADRSVPLDSVHRRVVRALDGGPGPVSEASPANPGDDRELLRVLREALAPRYSSSAEGAAAGALKALRETAAREGLTRQQFVDRAHELARHIGSKGRGGQSHTAGKSTTRTEAARPRPTSTTRRTIRERRR